MYCKAFQDGHTPVDVILRPRDENLIAEQARVEQQRASVRVLLKRALRVALREQAAAR